MRSLAAQFLATVLTNLYLVVGSLVFSLMTQAFGLWDSSGAGPYRCARWWARGLVLMGWVSIDCRQEAPLDPAERYVFFANHQSLYDIPVLLQSLPVPARFLAKKSLFQIPIFGRAMRVAGFVPVERGGGPGAARQALESASSQLEAGRSILLFPEETRSLTGEILPFKAGGLLIALRAGARIVPVGIDGTRHVRPKGSVLVRPGQVRVRYGAPLDPSQRGVRGKREILAQLRTEISRLSGAPLAGEAEVDSQE